MDSNADESHRLLNNQNSNEISSEEEWSDEVSEEESYSSDSDSSVPEWESSINDDTGELLYIDCHPFVIQNIDNSKPKEPLQPFLKNQLRRSTRGKFLKLIRRRESQRHSRRYATKNQDNLDTTTTKVKFHDSQDGEEKEVLLKVNKDNLQKDYGLVENFLGINVGTLSDGSRIMIAGFVPDSEAKHEKNIKIGDWLKSVNNVSVTSQNLSRVIESFADKNEVLLKLQRVTGVEVTKDPPINEINCQSKFVRELIEFTKDEQKSLVDKLYNFPIGVIFLNTEQLKENCLEFADVIYVYPFSFQKSIICQSRGIFITLNHLVNEVTQTKVSISSFLYREKLCHVTYTGSDKNLLLLMFPDCVTSSQEAIFVTKELIRLFNFLYENLEKAFLVEHNRLQMDHFFARFFTKVINGNCWTASEFITSKSYQDLVLKDSSRKFEEVLPASKTLRLSTEACIKIDDALTELEASDYREWNEEPLDCQRLFTILGSALYHDGYLLASHLMYQDLIDVHIFCRQQGFFHLSETEPIKTLIFWKEVFPQSCNKQLNSKIPIGRRYLLIIGSRKDLLAVIMEAGGCTEPADDNMGPDAFYVEEVQATLAHIQELGIPEMADRYLACNPGPQVTVPESCNKRKSEFFKTIKDTRKPEVTSILKRRNSDQFHVATANFYGSEDRMSEDSGSVGNSEIIEEEESDFDDFADGSQSNSSFDISELRQSILNENEDLDLNQLTTGKENVLFHFVQFDSTEGVLVGPPDCSIQSQTLEEILINFRQTCHKIHLLFANTLRFKNMPAQDMAKSVMNKSLIAIKEHGVLFECPFLDDTDNKKSKIKYWVIGRLFYMPHPREVYVCYQDNIPQNIIELAFKIDLSTMN